MESKKSLETITRFHPFREWPLRTSLGRGFTIISLVAASAILSSCAPRGITDAVIEENCNQLYRPTQQSESFRIAYTHARTTIEQGRIKYTGSNIGVVEDEKQFHRLTYDTDSEEHHAFFSPDGNQIVFVRWGIRNELPNGNSFRETHDREGVYAINRDGSNLTALALQTDPKSEFNEPIWSEDSSQVAFIERDKGTSLKDRLIVADANGSKSKVLVDNFPDKYVFFGKKFSPDNKSIGFSSKKSIYLVDIETKAVREITTAEEENATEGQFLWLDQNNILTETLYPVLDSYSLVRNFHVNLETGDRREVTSFCRPSQGDLDELDQAS